MQKSETSGGKGSVVSQALLVKTNELELIVGRDPVADASAAISSNDLRFIAILGAYVPQLPGVTEEDRPLTTNDVRFVNGQRQLFSRTYDNAKEYVAKYNHQIAEYRRQTKAK